MVSDFPNVLRGPKGPGSEGNVKRGPNVMRVSSYNILLPGLWSC